MDEVKEEERELTLGQVARLKRELAAASCMQRSASDMITICNESRALVVALYEAWDKNNAAASKVAEFDATQKLMEESGWLQNGHDLPGAVSRLIEEVEALRNALKRSLTKEDRLPADQTAAVKEKDVLKLLRLRLQAAEPDEVIQLRTKELSAILVMLEGFSTFVIALEKRTRASVLY